ncbi:MAG TPA: hypothetical protein VGJ84_11305, partial [Polyangiaceae bacterium]
APGDPGVDLDCLPLVTAVHNATLRGGCQGGWVAEVLEVVLAGAVQVTDPFTPPEPGKPPPVILERFFWPTANETACVDTQGRLPGDCLFVVQLEKL